MRTIWLHMSVILLLAIGFHEFSMAIIGHSMLAGSTESMVESDPTPTHRHGQPAFGETDHAPTNLPDPCDPIRVAFAQTQKMSPMLDDSPVAALLPIPAWSTFAATSRPLVESPPPRPPDLTRAFFQVYRI